ncbi:acetyl-CoA synthetase-like protein [Polyplosphaeria fusca]|uniref:Acetyl-CoA synthetase-like protein n=1 Tax=Polyplosphaeria fusca TaxID=682080 RepID=A0A9P4V0D7_9PLEO|nr:acetyl-CoA synthetase-like protein [Polyplosphaeria fusca]
MSFLQDGAMNIISPLREGNFIQSNHGISNAQPSLPISMHPLSRSQEALWLDYEMDPQSTKYNLTLSWKFASGNSLSSAPSTETIVKGIHQLTTRHVVLRSLIAKINGRAHMIERSIEEAQPDIRILDTRKAVSSVVATLHRPFDLRTELPARWWIVRGEKSCMVYLVAHHVAVDGQSMSILSNELLEIIEGRGTLLAPAPPPNLLDRSTDHKIQSEHAATILSQLKSRNTLPWLKSEPLANASNQPYRKIQTWTTFAKADLEAWSTAYHTSWFRIATSLLGLLIVDHSRPRFSTDEVITVAFGGRPKGMENHIGQFTNGLPVKLPLWEAVLDGDGRFKTFVGAVSNNISRVKRAETVSPIEVAAMCRDSNMLYTPPKVAVSYSPALADSRCRLFPVEGSWDLFFCFLQTGDNVQLGVVYDPVAISEELLLEMNTKFARWLDASRSDPDELKILQMLDWVPKIPSLPLRLGETQISSSQGHFQRHVHHWIDAHATSTPGAIAMDNRELNISMTYGELYKSTNEKTTQLLLEGASKECVVLIQLPRGFAVIEWIIAVLKCGAAFVYLDPASPSQQRQIIESDCRPRVVVDAEYLIKRGCNNGTKNFPPTPPNEAVDSCDSTNKTNAGTSNSDLAYIIYTSGSTGSPKGVQIEHGNLANFVRASQQAFRCGYGSRVLQLASFAFDASILEWTAALCTGGCLCFAEHPQYLVGEYLADVLELNRVSFLQATPTVLETLPLHLEMSNLLQISIGGEKGARSVFESWHSRGIDLVHAYGPSETSIAVSLNKIEKTEDLPEIISVGPPLPGVSFHIFEEASSQAATPGVAGEVCVSGNQVGRGYCDRIEATSKSFFIGSDGQRTYRTGDRGYLLDDGSLVVSGRLDRELKIRGFRIAPEEIEGALLDAGIGVLEASVHPSQDGLGIWALVAPETTDSESLVEALKKTLPSYKIPTILKPINSLPKSISGKVDHKAVKQLLEQNCIRQKVLTAKHDDAPSISVGESADEDKLAQIWEDLISPGCLIPRDVNFFDVGGHSLLVPKLLDQLRTAFPSQGLQIRVLDLFHHSTIKTQARFIQSLRPAALKSPETPPVATSVPTISVNPNTDKIAIIGISGRFPGASNADDFYSRLMAGYSEITTQQWSCPRSSTRDDGMLWVPRAGILSNIEAFDARFWHLSDEDATDMDPQHRLFLEVAHEALVDAGIDVFADAGKHAAKKIGVFVGSANPSYHQYTESTSSNAWLRENRALAMPSISARAAYHLNLTGPNVTVQVNCASSTVAFSLACDALRLGRCEVAIVGGVSIQLYEGGYATGKGGIFSPSGECRPFDAHADGTVPADAVTAIVLTKYSPSQLENTPIYAKVLGTAIGSDGAVGKAGYQVPSPRGVADVMKAAWTEAGTEIANLRYAELHTGGTPIGDALELEALTTTMRETVDGPSNLTVGCVKANIGNAQHASGLVSIIKLCKAIQHGVIPRTKDLESVPDVANCPDIDLARKDTRLRAGDALAVSALGWGGLASHIVLGCPGRELQKQVLPLSDGIFTRKIFAAPRIKVVSKS